MNKETSATFDNTDPKVEDLSEILPSIEILTTIKGDTGIPFIDSSNPFSESFAIRSKIDRPVNEKDFLELDPKLKELRRGYPMIKQSIQATS